MTNEKHDGSISPLLKRFIETGRKEAPDIDLDIPTGDDNLKKAILKSLDTPPISNIGLIHPTFHEYPSVYPGSVEKLSFSDIHEKVVKKTRIMKNKWFF